MFCEFPYRRNPKLPNGIPNSLICAGDSLRGQGDACHVSYRLREIIMNEVILFCFNKDFLR